MDNYIVKATAVTPDNILADPLKIGETQESRILANMVNKQNLKEKIETAHPQGNTFNYTSKTSTVYGVEPGSYFGYTELTNSVYPAYITDMPFQPFYIPTAATFKLNNLSAFEMQMNASLSLTTSSEKYAILQGGSVPATPATADYPVYIGLFYLNANKDAENGGFTPKTITTLYLGSQTSVLVKPIQVIPVGNFHFNSASADQYFLPFSQKYNIQNTVETRNNDWTSNLTQWSETDYQNILYGGGYQLVAIAMIKNTTAAAYFGYYYSFIVSLNLFYYGNLANFVPTRNNIV